MQRDQSVGAAARSGWFEPLDWVLVRTPLLPLRRYAELAGAGGDHDSRADGDSRFSTALADPSVLRAVAVASPSLFEQLDRPSRGPSAARRRRQGLLRYLIRMSTRCTPYGLMAGVSLAGWGDRTDLELGEGELARARVDMGLIDALVDQLESRLELVRMLRLRTHPLVAVRAGRAFLPERFSGETGAFEVSVRATAAVKAVLEACRRTALPFGTLTDDLGARFPEADAARIEGLIHRLLTEGLLVSELRPPLTRGDPAAHILAALEPIAAARSVREQLAAVVDACERWPRDSAGAGAAHFSSVAGTARSLAPSPSGVPPVRVDMARPLIGNRITREVAIEAARAAELLLRLSPLRAGMVSLNAYRDGFLERYGGEAEVPVTELLDADLGLGPVDLRLDAAPGAALGEEVRERDRALLRIAATALRTESLSVELDGDTISTLEVGAELDGVPSSAELTVFLSASSRDELDAGEFTLVVSPMLGSHGAGRILGRFADMLGAMQPAA